MFPELLQCKIGSPPLPPTTPSSSAPPPTSARKSTRKKATTPDCEIITSGLPTPTSAKSTTTSISTSQLSSSPFSPFSPDTTASPDTSYCSDFLETEDPFNLSPLPTTQSIFFALRSSSSSSCASASPIREVSLWSQSFLSPIVEEVGFEPLGGESVVLMDSSCVTCDSAGVVSDEVAMTHGTSSRARFDLLSDHMLRLDLAIEERASLGSSLPVVDKLKNKSSSRSRHYGEAKDDASRVSKPISPHVERDVPEVPTKQKSRKRPKKKVQYTLPKVQARNERLYEGQGQADMLGGSLICSHQPRERRATYSTQANKQFSGNDSTDGTAPEWDYWDAEPDRSASKKRVNLGYFPTLSYRTKVEIRDAREVARKDRRTSTAALII